MDFESETLVAQSLVGTLSCDGDRGGTVAGALIAFNAREDTCVYGDKSGALGTSHPQAQAGADAGEIAPTLRAMGHSGSHANAGGQLAVAIPILEIGKRTGSGGEGRNGCGIGEAGDPMFTLQASAQHGAMTEAGVRRLTPIECEKLQGFPIGYTLIPVGRRTSSRIDADYASYIRRSHPGLSNEEISRLAADGPRYRALGNSMAVPCMGWIGMRLARQEAKTAPHTAEETHPLVAG